MSKLLEGLIREGMRDRDRPWDERATGGLLAVVVVAAVIGGVVADLLSLAP